MHITYITLKTCVTLTYAYMYFLETHPSLTGHLERRLGVTEAK